MKEEIDSLSNLLIQKHDPVGTSLSITSTHTQALVSTKEMSLSGHFKR